MMKIYETITEKKCFPAGPAGKIVLAILIMLTGFLQKSAAQVTVTATAGIPAGSYTTLKAAFDAINTGDHKGDIIINITASTNEGTTPATLNSSDADPASYTSVLIQPTANNVVVSGNPAAGFAVIQLNGSDNVTINGDNPNIGGQARALTVNNTAAASSVGNACIRVCTSSSIINADNISILNCVLNGNVVNGNVSSPGSSSGTSFGIYVGGNAGATVNAAPVAITAALEPAPAGTSIKSFVAQSNAINQCGKGVVFNAAASTVSDGVTISQNLIGTVGVLGVYPYATPVTTVYATGIWVAGTNGVTVSNNTINNIVSYVSASIAAIELNTNVTGAIDISGNIISGVVSNTGNNMASGISVNPTTGTFNIEGNTISNVENISGSSTAPAGGIRINTATGAGTILSNKINAVTNWNTGGGPAQGINLALAPSGTLIQNNFISDIMNIGATSFGNSANANGILLNSGNNHKVYHNSINLFGTSTSTSANSINCLAISANTQTGIDIRNNAFSNTVSGGSATDVHTCLFLPFAVSSSMKLTLNNNAYYTGNTPGLHGIAFAGSASYNIANLYIVANFDPSTTGPATNWRNFSAALGNGSNDFASFATTAAAPFTSATNLHIPAATSTQLESGGADLSVLTDIDGAARNANFPDIGADEFAGTLADNTAPNIAYTALPFTCALGNRSLVATITDPSGVPTSGAGLPVLYWSINGGSYVPATGGFLGSGQYQFNFGAGAIAADVVTYYIVAQDNAGNVVASPSIGANGYTTSPPAVSTDPTIPETYTIQNTLTAGTYNVGVGQTYTTITAAINDYNTSCLGGAIIFKLVDASYPSETYPIVIGNPEADATNTLMIQPGNLAVTVSGSNATALFKLNGADYVTFDGLNTGFSTLTVTNTNASGSVFWIASNGSDGATNNTIRNCKINAGGTATAFAAIVAGSGSIVGDDAEGLNSDNSITSCTIKSAITGIYINGHVGSVDQNWLINNNTFGSATAADKFGLRGIFIERANNFTISGNTISGVTNSSATAPSGILVSDNTTNGTITKNKISDIKQATGNAGSYGIELASNVNASNIAVTNNFIWDVAADGSSIPANNGNGLVITTGGGYSIYYNSVSMGTNQVNTGGITAAIRIAETVTLANSLDIRNNIFSNTSTVGNVYSIYNESGKSIFSNIDYNDYYAGASPFFGFLEGDAANLPAWQAATTKDAKSVSVNPNFVSAVNIHLQPSSQLNGMAVTIGSVTTDIDNTARVAPSDIGADEFDATDCAGTPFVGVINASAASLCGSGTVLFTAAGFAAADGLTYQWQYSTDGFTTPIDMVGQTIPTNATSGVINVTTSFRLKITCTASGLSGYSNVRIVAVNNPVVSTTTPATRCGTGSVTLAATTVTSGATLSWYSTPTGGTALGTGTSFVTPVIAATTNYYVAASLGSTTGSVGPTSPSSQGGSIGTQNVDWKVYFDVLQTGTLISVDIFPKVAGLASTLYVKNAAGTILGTYAYTTLYSGGATAQTITMNLAMVPGTGYYFEGPGTIQNLYRNTSGASYPYTSPVINITGNAFDNTYYMCYYNLKYSGSCASARTTVTATITPAPAITPVATPAIICIGSSSVLSVTSPNNAYNYTWTPGPLSGASVTVTPAATTTYTVTANDGTCSTTGTVTVQVRPLPSAVLVSPSTANLCVNSPATLLTATGGTLINVSALSENFNGATNGWTKINNSTGGIPANAAWTLRPNGYVYTTPTSYTFNSNDASQFYLSNSESQGSGSTTNTILQSPAFSLSGYTTANLSFWHHLKYLGGESAIVEISTDGSIWNPLPGGTFTSDQGTSNGFVNANLNMDSYAGQATVYIRFRYNNATFAWWWAIDNISVTGNVTTNVTWTQAPVAPNSLFTDASASIPYTLGTASNTVYTHPAVTTVYTATSTGPAPSNCASSSTATITVTPPVSVTITASENPVCPSTSVTFTAVVVNGGPSPSYQWQVNGANVGTNSPTYTFVPSNGDLVTVVVIGNATCTYGNPATSNTVTMSVAPPSGVAVSISSSAGNSICIGTTVTFTATPTNGGPSPSYQWKINGANVGTNSSTFVTSTLNNGDPVTCVMTSNSTCVSGTNIASSGQILMTVNNYGPPGVVIGIFANSTTICAGTSVTVRATPQNQGLAPLYQYYLNNVPQGWQTSNDYTFTPVNGDKIKVKLAANYTCRTGPTDTANSNTLTMTVLASAPASVTLSNSATLCSGSSITFTATPTNGGLTPSYDFLLNGITVQSGAGNTYILAAPVNGNTVQAILTSSFSCATGNPASSAIYTVALNASPTVSAAADCNNILTGSGQQVTLTATAAAGSGTISTYQWYLGAAPIVGATASTYVTNVAGSYTVKVTNSNGCSTTSTAVVITGSAPPLAAGTYVIPGTGCNGFDKIASAVNYINAHGIAGAVIFNITPGYTETAPAGGFAITATGTAANTIKFQKNGAGANPVITAGLQAAGTNNDGIFKIIGGDYITIRDLTLQENSGNTVTAAGASNTMTEWGFALLYASTTDGPNHDTIQNNSISLNKNYPNSFGIYSNLRHNATAVATNADITNTSGGSNKIYSNVISNVNNPLLLIGAGAANLTPGNDIGGTSAATSNTITDWGSNTVNSGNGTFFGVPADMNGIYAANQSGLNISWNNITSATGVNAGAAALRGICTDFTGTAPSGTFTDSVTNNAVTLSSAATAGTFEAIKQLNTVGSAAVTGATININNNTISSDLSGAASAVTITGIANAFPAGVLNISNNILKGNTSTATTGGFTGITNTGAVATTININNNQFGDAATNAVTFGVATNGAVQGILNTGGGVGSVLSVNGNSFTKFVHTIAGSSDHTYISNTMPVSAQNINANIFSGINTNSNGVFTGISAYTNNGNKLISGNSFTSITGGSGNMTMIRTRGSGSVSNNNIGNNTPNSITGSGSLIGIDLQASAVDINAISNTVTGLSSTGTAATTLVGIYTAATNPLITGNRIAKLGSSGNGGSIFGIFIDTGITVNVSLDTIYSLKGTGTGNVEASGIYNNGGITVNYSRNIIYDIEEQASAGGANPVVNGIRMGGGLTVTASNNFISDLKAPAANSINAIDGISVSSPLANSTYNVYYNSIYLNAASTGTDFGTSGIFHLGSATATTAALNLRNNIIDNESTANGTGLTVAYRNANTNLANYAVASNNNLYYAGSIATPGPLYYDGTNTETTITGLQARLASRDAASISMKPVFVSVTDLHLVPGSNCSTDGAAAPIAGITDDIDADTRDAVTPDIGADEFTGTGVGAGVWKGVNTDWTDIQNWCDAVPGVGTNVIIPAGRPFYPIITTATPISKNISIAAGGTVTITGAGKLSIAGTITNAGTFNVADGTIEMIGSTAQTIPANVFQNNDLKNLVISNSAASPGVTLGGALNLYGKLAFTGSSRTFTTAGFLTLRSTATGTASVGDITNNGTSTNNTITGDVSVERFASARRAWRFLSVPTQNNLQTIHEAWQENQSANATTPAGYGIHITKDSANYLAYGFDLRTTAGPSMKVYQPATGTWKGITSTINVPGISDGKFVTGTGYMTLVRGDRTVNSFPQAATTTVLRDKGALVTGTFAAPAIGAGQFAAIGNPYASAVDFSKLTKTNLQDVYYMWDPQLGSLGGYQTFTGPNPYSVTPGGASYNSGNYYIESGQAFFVHSSGPGGTLSFNEPAKVDGSNLVLRTVTTAKQLRTNIYVNTSGTLNLFDGVLSQFDDSYSNSIDALDAVKLVNFSENLAMKVGDTKLSVERRTELSEADTIFYNLSQVRVQNYQFEFIPENIGQPGLTGFLEDNYLHTSTPVSMESTTKVDFNVVNDPGSYAADRFRLVFKQLGPVPVTFTSVRANKQNKNILVEWKVDNELNIHHYDVEKSADGHSFSKVHEELARGNNGAGSIQYNWLDTNPWDGDNFYRIRSIGAGNENKLSQVVKVNMAKLPSAITVFPNPVAEDGILYVGLDNKPAGNYQVSIVNAAGQTVSRKTLNHAGGNSVFSIVFDKHIAHGNYMINITGSDNVSTVFKIVY